MHCHFVRVIFKHLYQLLCIRSLVIENRSYLAWFEQLHRIERESKLKVKLLLVIITQFMLEGKQMRPMYPCVYALLINTGFQFQCGFASFMMLLGFCALLMNNKITASKFIDIYGLFKKDNLSTSTSTSTQRYNCIQTVIISKFNSQNLSKL